MFFLLIKHSYFYCQVHIFHERNGGTNCEKLTSNFFYPLKEITRGKRRMLLNSKKETQKSLKNETQITLATGKV